jgi:hypothetical protein
VSKTPRLKYAETFIKAQTANIEHFLIPRFISSMEISQVEVLEIKDRRAEGLGNLQVLPDELICSILDNLTPRDVARFACVSRFAHIYIYIYIYTALSSNFKLYFLKFLF